MLTLFGGLAAAAMVASYALEPRDRRWIAAFAVACVGASIYAVATGAWVFAVLEGIWALVALRRFTVASPPP